ncbi:MAG: sterol desaturase family protein [Methylovulum sp.]|uniref:sterol desaturase family protein n=1 Tax=Methylovulum sp. TaxID=1916980 RepID=UPI00260E1314|nr:sterol desaturase family protein [Methylovulum sp.]MDD2723952.1 sterol desaturase family protein [Methylovulum sp.]MDD5125747.1 sterol desaturase family protein [Methylovulum sp.]
MLDLMTFLDDMTIKWPATLSPEGVAVILLAFFGLFSWLEQLFPHRHLPGTNLRRSYATNISFFVVNNTLMSLLSVSSLFFLAQHFSQQGLLRYINNSLVQFTVSFLLLDLLLYTWHRLCHRLDSLWLFHRVHHNDPYLNTSTAFRVHVLELLITNLLKAGYIVLLGVDQLMMLVNEMVIMLFTLFHHTNIRFTGEKTLGSLIIAPYLHRTHHSTERHEHDSNYGAVLSIWDRLSGTLNEREPKTIGIKGDSPQDLINLLKLGFNMPTSVSIEQPLPANLEFMIAEAAYYRAEKRNFSPGYELLDWLEAKKDILKRIYGEEMLKKQPAKYGLMALN